MMHTMAGGAVESTAPVRTAGGSCGPAASLSDAHVIRSPLVRPVRRAARWWLTHWLKYGEAVGAQWR